MTRVAWLGRLDTLDWLLVGAQVLDAVTFVIFLALFGDRLVRLVEQGSLTLLVYVSFGVYGFLAFKLGLVSIVALWPWHPERYNRWVVATRNVLMVAAGLSGFVGFLLNSLAIFQAGSVLW